MIALTLAAAWPDAIVTAVDISPHALSLAQENATRLGLTDRVRWVESDLLEKISPTTETFDLIVANLPYIPSGEISQLAREVRHDPLNALDGGPLGFEIYARFIGQAANYLHGRLALEIGHDQSAPLISLLNTHHFHNIRAQTDYQGQGRFLFANYG